MEPSDKQPTVSIQAELQMLRQNLRRYNAWPEAADNFIALMSGTNWNAPKPNDNDFQLLPRVINDVIAGKDIGSQYPAFFQKLLAHSAFRQMFIDTLQKSTNTLH